MKDELLQDLLQRSMVNIALSLERHNWPEFKIPMLFIKQTDIDALVKMARERFPSCLFGWSKEKTANVSYLTIKRRPVAT